MKAVFALLALASLAACGGGGGYGSTSPNTGTPKVNTPPPAGGISVTNNQFSPGTKTVAVGATLQWAWNTCTGGDTYGNGQSCVQHSVTFDDGSASSQLQDEGSFTRTFPTAGTYMYHCSLHGAQGMTGTITVQ